MIEIIKLLDVPLREIDTQKKLIFITKINKTTFAELNPILQNIWWIWFLSGKKGDFLFIILIVNTLSVSKIGIIKIANAVDGPWATTRNSINLIASAEIIKPQTSEPVSPIKIIAFLRLNLRNPSKPPTKQNATFA